MIFLFGNTSDWIGLGVLLLLALLALLAVAFLSRPYEVTPEEFERRAREEPSMLSAGFIGLQKILQPSVAKAVETQQDLKEGRYDGEQGSGEPPEPGTEGKSEREDGER
ncbi:MAG: hypothetical protein QOD75_756 [Blastocatellia bacterium]|jgi:hypothetical protein|nr:hypothetical protein [Blastocatellia bacterium]